jgi:hypothetical protein
MLCVLNWNADCRTSCGHEYTYAFRVLHVICNNFEEFTIVMPSPAHVKRSHHVLRRASHHPARDTTRTKVFPRDVPLQEHSSRGNVDFAHVGFAVHAFSKYTQTASRADHATAARQQQALAPVPSQK